MKLLPEHNSSASSDIDLAVRGIKPEDYFTIYGDLLMLSDHTIDLIDLDLQKPFGERLEKSDSLVRVS